MCGGGGAPAPAPVIRQPVKQIAKQAPTAVRKRQNTTQGKSGATAAPTLLTGTQGIGDSSLSTGKSILGG